MLSILVNHPVISGVIIGIFVLLVRLFIFPIVFKQIDSIGNVFYLFRLKKILNSGHSLVLYNVSYDGKSPQIKQNEIIESPLRIEDDLISSKVIPFVFYDPTTLKIKGYFHALNKESLVDKYASDVYEGHLVLIHSQECGKS